MACREGDIAERLAMVEAFMSCPAAAETFRCGLDPRGGGPPDCERLLPRAADKLAEVLVRDRGVSLRLHASFHQGYSWQMPIHRSMRAVPLPAHLKPHDVPCCR